MADGQRQTVRSPWKQLSARCTSPARVNMRLRPEQVFLDKREPMQKKSIRARDVQRAQYLHPVTTKPPLHVS